MDSSQPGTGQRRVRVGDLGPEVRLVYDELVNIRRRGLGYQGMALHGQKIQQLPCVEDELRRSSAHRDRVSAAIAAVQCAVRRVRGLEDRTYLRHLLFEPEEGQFPSSVPDRQRAAERALGQPPEAYDQKRSHAKMTAAHIELASLLVRLLASPCQPFDTETQIEELRRVFDDTKKLADAAIANLGRLAQLGYEDVEELRGELLRQIAVAFPQGTAKLGNEPTLTGSPALTLLTAVVLRRYPHQGRAWELMSAAELDAALGLGIGWPDLDPPRDGDLPVRRSDHYEQIRWNSIRLLDRLMRREEREGWPVLDEGGRIFITT